MRMAGASTQDGNTGFEATTRHGEISKEVARRLLHSVDNFRVDERVVPSVAFGAAPSELNNFYQAMQDRLGGEPDDGRLLDEATLLYLLQPIFQKIIESTFSTGGFAERALMFEGDVAVNTWVNHIRQNKYFIEAIESKLAKITEIRKKREDNRKLKKSGRFSIDQNV